MFLSAVLQAHTERAADTLHRSNQQSEPVTSKAPGTDAGDDHLPASLKAALAVPPEHRTVELPSIHRSRWV